MLSLPIESKYQMTSDDIQLCIQIGKERLFQNCKEKRKNLKYSHRDDLSITIQGCIGELMMLRLFDLPITDFQQTHCRNAYNDSFDLVIDGHTVDVKTVLSRKSINNKLGIEYDLTVSKWKAVHPPTLYCLLSLECVNKNGQKFYEANEITGIFKGMCQSKDVFQLSNLQKGYNNQEYYVYPAYRLLNYPDVLTKDSSAIVAPLLSIGEEGTFF